MSKSAYETNDLLGPFPLSPSFAQKKMFSPPSLHPFFISWNQAVRLSWMKNSGVFIWLTPTAPVHSLPSPLPQSCSFSEKSAFKVHIKCKVLRHFPGKLRKAMCVCDGEIPQTRITKSPAWQLIPHKVRALVCVCVHQISRCHKLLMLHISADGRGHTQTNAARYIHHT